jgi:CheY-like chemotaxis protein
METIVAVVTDLFFAVKVADGAKRAGREVKFGRTLDETVELVRTAMPALIVADLQCREVDSIELARRLKGEPGLATVPLLGFVSHVQEERKQAALTAGFDKVVARSTFSDKARELLSA